MGIILSKKTSSVKTWDFELDFGADLNVALAAMYAAGGGTLLCNAKEYNLPTLIDWPGPAGATLEPITLEIRGVMPPQTVPFCPGSGGNTWDVPLPKHGTVFQIRSAPTTAAFFANLSALTQGMMVFRNLQILMPGNPQGHCISAGWLANLITDNVIVGVRNATDGYCTTGKGAGAIPQPLNAATMGIVYPGEGNGGTSKAVNTSVFGFGIGVQHSEHFIADNLTVFKNLVGIRVQDGWHAATYERVSVYWNTTGIRSFLNGANQTNPAATKPVTRLVAHQVDSEETDEASAWYKTLYHVDDPYDRLRGRIRWHRMKAGVGITGPLLRRGGAYMDLAPVGSNPRATLDAIGFSVADAVGLPASKNGLPATIPRGAFSTSGQQAMVSTVSATDTPAVWPIGDPRVLLRTLLTVPASGGVNVGLCVNYVDASNYILCVFTGTGVTIQKYDTAVYTVVASAVFAYTAGSRYEFTVIQRGQRVEVWADGTALTVAWNMTAAEWTKYSAGLSHGLYAYTATGYETGLARWDHLQVESPGMLAVT